MRKLTLLFTFIIISNLIYSQITLTNGLTAAQLAENLAGENITTTAATITGDPEQYGTFTYVGAGLETSSGVILSTGNIFDAVGPNDEPNTSSGYGGPGDPDLSDLAGFDTHDAVVFTFDFEVQTDYVEFQYIFLSEEYNEFVNTGFNDVFAFYISGPGIVGKENLAVVPDTDVPVTINTINNDTYWQYYVDNEDPPFEADIEYDGFTTLMTASKGGLIPCETYTLELKIADGSDAAYDAAVLLQENSLVQANVSAVTNTANADGIALEGCIQASFTFDLDSAYAEDIIIPYGIGGNATNGVDYHELDTFLTIPAGQTSATIIIDAYADGIDEGQEAIELYFEPAPCEDLDTVILLIDDNDPIEFELSGTDLSCADDGSGILDILISGGNPPYTITLTDTTTHVETVYSSTELPIIGLDATTYSVYIQDVYGCDADAVVIGGDFDADTTFLPDGTGVTYTSDIDISGFNAGQTLTDVSNINSICATMEHSYANDLTIILEAPNGTQVMLKNVGPTGGDWNKCNMGEPVASAAVDNWNSSNITPGVGYEYCWTNDPTYLTMGEEIANHNVPWYTYVSTWGNTLSDYYLPPGSYTPVQSLAGFVGTELNGTWTLHVTDNYNLDNGYIFDWNISLTSDLPDSTITLGQPDPIDITGGVTSAACAGSNGEIDITPSGDYPPYSFNWSTGATTEDVTGLAAGTYNVTVTDNNTCSNVASFNVSNAVAVTIAEVVTDVTCPGAGNGMVDLTITGGTPPYNFSWSNAETTEDITNLTPGNYTVSVTDDNGCITIQSFNVGQITPVDITAVLTNETCGEVNGIIDITVTDGTSPYTYLWSTGATTEDVDELAQGSYDVTVTDNNGCTFTDSYSLINLVGDCNPDCDLAYSNENIIDETCGNGDGSISMNLFTSYSPYSVEWSNGATTTNISGLSAGTYTLTVTDAEGCELIEDFIINNETGSLAISNVISTDDYCGNAQGAVNITVSGGALPYSYSWSSGESTEDISDLYLGTYDVTVTDANGCDVTTSVEIFNNTGTLNLDYGNAVDETCGNGQGSIDIVISGGNTPYDYNWSNGSGTEDLININAGTYSCTITDDDGCSIITPDYIVNNNSGDLNLDNIDVDNEICGNTLGEIEIVISGGNTPYSYSWSNGETTQNIYNLNADTYSGTITDASGCSVLTGDLNLINESGTLSLNDITALDETCGNSQGQVNLTTSGGTTPLTYQWSNGSTSEDLFNVSEGTYFCTVTDSEGCEIQTSATVNNNTGTLSVLNVISSDEICADASGDVDLVVTGDMPLTYNWSSGQTSQDISGLSEGTYDCTITDVNGCEVYATATINNDAGTLNLDNVILTNEICGNGTGSIDLVVSGVETPFTYNWDSGESTEDITGLSAGDYTCTITDNVGCSTIAGPFTINDASGDLVINSALVVDEDCGNGTGAIDVDFTGGTAPITFSWSSGQTTEDLTGLSEGTYTITITDVNSCQTSETYNIVNNAGTLSIDSYSVTDEICGNGTGSIDLTVSGGAAPYNYNWSSGQTSEDLSGLSEGTYHVTVTDDNGCEVMQADINLIDNPGSFSLVSIEATDEECGNGTGNINVTLSGGAVPIIYNWSTGQTTQDINSLNAGIYSCTTTDGNGCILEYSTTVANNAGSLLVDDAVVSEETCTDENGQIDLTIIGGTAPYTFLWSDGSTGEDLINVPADDYTCLITDDNGCTTNYFGTVTNTGADLAITSITTDSEICNNGMGEIDIDVTGGTTPYNYIWSNGAISQDLIMLSEGTYDVTVTEANGCVVETSIEVYNSSGTLDIANAVVSDENCNDGMGSINLTITGGDNPVLINWSNGATSPFISNLSAGSYEVTITDDNGCEIIESYDVINFTGGFEISSETVNTDYCNQATGDIEITVAGGTAPYTYQWSSGETTEDISGLVAGEYIVSITDDVACTLIQTYTVDNTTNGMVYTSATVDEDCHDGAGSIDLNVTGGTSPYTYNWSDGSSSEDLADLSGGMYEVTIADNTGCETVASFEIENILPSGMGFVNIVTTDDYCGLGNGEVSFSTEGPGTFSYELDGTVAGTPYFNELDEGDYVISIVDISGCQIDSTISIGNIASYTVNVSHIFDDNCANGEGALDIIVEPAGTYYYEWSNGETTEDIYNLYAGTYTCTISDDSGCINYFTADIADNTLLSAEATVTDEYCGDAQGEVDLTVSGGIGPYTYAWNNGETSEDIASLSEGSYTVTATDANSCSVIFDVIVGNNTGTMEISAVVTDDNCYDGIGAIDITITGGSGNYAYGWSHGPNTEDITNLYEGTYEVIVFDLDWNCRLSQEFEIVNNGSFEINFTSVSDVSCSTTEGGSIELFMNPPTGSYNFSWSNGETTQNIYDLDPGSYTVTVTDFWGCMEIFTGIVGTESDISSSAIATDEYCSNSEGSIDITVTGGVAPFSYLWSNGETTEDLTNIGGGTYTCTVTDDEGCISICSAEVLNSTDIVASATITEEYCGDSQGEIDLNVTAGTAPYTYSWSNGESTEDLSGLTEGTYFVTITDDVGCEYTEEYIVTNNTGAMAASAGISDDNCYNSEGSIDISITGGSGNYSYQWNTGETSEDLTGLSEGIYYVTVFDVDLNCKLTEEYQVLNNGDFEVSSADITEVSCGGANDGAIELALDPASGTYEFDWSNGETTQNIYDLGPGTYSVTITDEFDCIVIYSGDVTSNTDMETSLVVIHDNCSSSTGSINITVTGGALPYTYEWNTGETTEGLTNIGEGTYICTITDDAGCVTIETVEITNSTDIATTQVITEEYCGDGQGEIDITMIAGTAPFVYNWSNGETTEDLSGLSEGDYSVTITDDYGCILELDFTVNNNTGALEASATITNDYCNFGDGEIDLNIIGGSGNYAFDWSNSETTEDITDLNAGTYSVMIFDIDLNCRLTEEYTVENEGAFEITDDDITDATCETCDDGSIDITVSGGGGPGGYNYAWSNGETTQDITDLLPGEYTVTITNGFGCEIFETYIVGYPTFIVSDEFMTLIVYPNPSSGIFNVETENLPETGMKYTVVNLLGKIISEGRINSNKVELDISGNEAGFYYLLLENGNVIKLVLSQ